MRRFMVTILIASHAAIAGCDCGRVRRRPAPAEPTSTSQAATPSDAPPFTVTMLPVDTYAVGREGIVSLEIALRDGTRFSPDYPIRVSVRSPGGLGMIRGTYERADAKSATETRMLFELPVLPSQTGTGTIDGTVIFAACEGESCEPKSVPIAVELNVQ